MVNYFYLYNLNRIDFINLIVYALIFKVSSKHWIHGAWFGSWQEETGFWKV